MQKIFDNHHAEVAPPIDNRETESWYVPIFAVYHPRKPSSIRVVFDSASMCEGTSLNSVLLRGPDLMNDLLGILLRFRREPVGIIADIQQMFFCFEVSEKDRDYLRFWWHADNDLDRELIEYRMNVHIFGNVSSPATAIYGLRRAAHGGEQRHGSDTREFIERDFYVDDGVTSLRTEEEAISLLKRTQSSLYENGQLRLHKITSNSAAVMNAFPNDDLAKDLKDLDLKHDLFPLQRSLGMTWNINTDMFTFQTSGTEKPFTRRGVLSVINGIFDPMGFAAPVVVEGKCIMRDLISDGVDWDDTLPPEYYNKWEQWKSSLVHLENLQIPRTILPVSFSGMESRELHVYSDASENAIAAVSYLKMMDTNGKEKYGFVLGKAKVAPSNGHTIPRLELCAAVLGIEVALIVGCQLNIAADCVHYHTDSRIVLGYISNNTKRFSVYVTNRVEKIRKHSKPSQWKYVASASNPADQGTRPVTASALGTNPWLLGPAPKLSDDHRHEDHDATRVEKDATDEMEIRSMATHTSINSQNLLGSHRFENFSKWNRLVKCFARLKALAKKSHKHIDSQTEPLKKHSETEAELFLISQVQKEVYHQELEALKSKTGLPKSSSIISLNPQLDNEGMLRVGGRLSNSELGMNEKYPLIIPGKHHIATLLVRHHHEQIHHQGRHLSEGAVRSAGLWITGVKRLVASVIHHCVTCRKLRGPQEQQIMSDLPADRVTQTPPFTNVGVDTFGPWTIAVRKTRGQTNSKRWALLFTCLSTRAIHIEVIEEMSTSSFINALRRFIALRGNVQLFRSDRGTNFVGATDILGVHSVNVEDSSVKSFINGHRATWLFNPPHASHMGGVWERMIGVVRRILDHMMSEISHKNLSHEVLTTFLAEVCAIVNSRPIVPVSTDSSDPFILTPSTLLTQKTNHSVEPLIGCTGTITDLYKKQWKQVQLLADTFWVKWKKEYLQSLQHRRKWTENRPNINTGDIVLIRDKTTHRNSWPVGKIVEAIPSTDGKVRKATVRVCSNGKPTLFVRPIAEMVLLCHSDPVCVTVT